MKLTQKQLAEWRDYLTSPQSSEAYRVALMPLLDHIRAVEAERDEWRTMAGRLATSLRIIAGLEQVKDYDALVAREGKL